MTVGRLADAFRQHMTAPESFDAVMEAAALSPRAVKTLEEWLEEWRAKDAAQRVRVLEEEARRLEAEIEALRGAVHA